MVRRAQDRPAEALSPIVATAAGPLAGIRALDFAQAAAGPVALMYLAMLGADVIKIEPPRGDISRHALPAQQGMGTTYLGNNLGKRSVVLDLKAKADLDAAKELIKTADVAVDNFRGPETMQRLGLGYDTMRQLNPRVIYVQSSGFGNAIGFDRMACNEWIAQALGGFAGVTGVKNGHFEESRGTAYFDWFTALINVQAIVVALAHRQQSGAGQMIQTSQYAATLFAGFTRFAEYLGGGDPPRPFGSERANIVPDMVLPTSDGSIALSAPTDPIWKRLCTLLGFAQWLGMSMSARIANRDAICEALRQAIITRSTAEWATLFTKYRIPHSDVDSARTISQILADNAQVNAQRMMVSIPSQRGDLLISPAPWHFGRTPALIRRTSPELGENQDEVLDEIASRTRKA